MALARIQVKQAIGSLTDETPTARLCTRFYEQTRQALLREFPWPFCEQYYTLALAETQPNARWGYSYRYPTGALRINDVVSEQRIPDPKIPFKVGSDSQGRLIYTDEESAVIAANADISDTSQMDPLFVDAFAWRMAVELSAPLSESTEVTNYANVKYEQAIRRAMSVAMNEDSPDEYEGGLMRARE
jgi:hypothetical protein